MTLWMVWATVITALLGLAALIGERALRISGRQVIQRFMVAFVIIIIHKLLQVFL